MCCRPWTVASCPVTGTWPLRLFFFSTEMTEFAMPSLATRTPLMSLLAVSICSKIVPAWVLSQSGTDWFGPLTRVPSEYFGSSTELYPCANSVALLSVGEPFSSATLAFWAFMSVRHLSRPWPCSLPTATLSNDT